jgi:hypothetical protein
MKNQIRWTNEHLIYGLIFILALFLRLLDLGRVPLVEGEATWAYQAWQVMRGESPVLGSQVGYLSLTARLFALFGGSNFQARLWPALAGSLIVWLPLCFRERLRRIPALVLAGGFALDPALVSVSRIAGSPMPALVFLFLAGAAFHLRRQGWFLVTLFLGMFSGPSFWLGFSALAVTILLGKLLGLYDPIPYLRSRLGLEGGGEKTATWNPGAWAVPLLVIAAIGSIFFTDLEGISAWLASLPEFLRGWVDPSGFSAGEVLVHLAVSSPLTLIFGFAGFLFTWRKGAPLSRLVSIWFAVTLLLLLIYRGRQQADLIWLSLPLWIGTAEELVRIRSLVKDTWLIYGLAGLVAVLFTLNWLTFTGMVFQIADRRTMLLQWGLIAASLALILLAMTIVGSEWGWPSAKKGLSYGLALMLMLYTVSATVQGAYLRAGDPRSLWSDGMGAGQVDLLIDSIGNASLGQTGRRDSIQVALVRGSEGMKWALRNLKDLQLLDTFDPDELYPVVITSEAEGYLVPENSYRGQDFVLDTRPGWDGLIPPDWISWIAFRSGPLITDKVILWVRADITTSY